MTTKPNESVAVRRQVWKYILPTDDYNRINTDTIIKLPATHKIIHVGLDPMTHAVALWIEVPVVVGYVDTENDNHTSPENSQAHKLWQEATNEVFRVIPTAADLPPILSDSGPVSEPVDTSHWQWMGAGPPPNPPPVENRGRAGYTHIGTAIDTSFGYVYHIYQLKELNG